MASSANVSLLGRLQLQAQQWSQGVKQARGDLQQFQQSLQTNREAARNAGIALGAMATAATLAARSAVRTFSNFEQRMQLVSSVANATADGFERMRQAALEVGLETTLSASQSADALYELASAGFDAEQSVAALEATTNLAIATQSDLRTSALLVTGTLNQFGLAAEEAGRAADVFGNAITGSPANINKLGDAMRQAGPIAAALGVSLEETVGSLSALFEAGLQGGQAGSAIRFMLSRILDVTPEAERALADLGLTLEDVDPQVHGIVGVLESFEEAGLDAADAVRIFSARGGTAMLSFLNIGTERVRELIGEMETTGTIARIAEEQMQTFAGAVEDLSGGVETLAIIAGGFIASVLEPFISGMARVLDVVGSLPAPILAMGTALATAATAFTAVSAAVLLLGPRIQGIREAFRIYVQFLRNVPALSRALVASVVAQGRAFVTATAAARRYVAALTAMLARNLRPTALAASFRRLAASMVTSRNAMLGFTATSVTLTGVLPALAAGIRAVMAAARAHPVILALSAAIAGITLAISGVRNNVGGLGDAWDALVEAFEPAIETIRDVVTVIGDALGGAVEGTFGLMEEFAPFLQFVVVNAARLVAVSMVSLATNIRTVGNALMFVWELFTNPLNAMGNWAERQRDIMRDNNRQLLTITGHIESTREEAAELRDRLREVESEFQGEELIEQLEDMREEFEGNEQAVETINESLEDARDGLEEMRAGAESAAEQAAELSDELEGQELIDRLIDLKEEFEGNEQAIANVNEVLEEAREQTEGAEGATATWKDRLREVQAEFEGEALIEQLSDLQKEFKGNEEAVAAITAALEEAIEGFGEMKDEAQAAADEADEMAARFTDRFEGIRIGLIEDDTARQVAEVRREFEGLREEIREAANENDRFRGQSARFIGESFRLESEELTRIREEAQQERLDAERQQREQLVSEIEQREEAITRLVTEAETNKVRAARLGFEQRYTEAVLAYRRLEAEAEEGSAEMQRIIEARARELGLLESEYVDEVEGIWDGALTRLEERVRQGVRSTLEAEGDDRGLLHMDFDEALRDWREFWDAQVEDAEGNAQQLARIEEERAADRERIVRSHFDEMIELSREEADARIEAQERVEDLRIETTGTEVEQRRHDFERTLRDLNSFYDDRVEAAQGNADIIEDIEASRAEAIRIIERQLQDDLAEMGQERGLELFQFRVDQLTADLDDASVATLRHMERQLNAWREAYVGNEGAVAIVDEAMDRIQGRIEGATSEFTDRAVELLIDPITEGMDEADAATLESMQSALRAARETYAGNDGIVAVIDEASDQVENRLSRLGEESANSQIESSERVREALEARGRRTADLRVSLIESERERLRAEYEQQVEDVNDFYDEQRDAAEDDSALRWRIEYERGKELRALREEHVQAVQELNEEEAEEEAEATEEIEEALAERADRIDRLRAEFEGPREQARVRHEQEVADVKEHYAELEEEAAGNSERLQQIAADREEELALLRRQFEEELAGLGSEEMIAEFERATSEMTDSLGDATVATALAMRDQLLAWKETYSGRDGIVAVLDEALGQVEGHIRETSDLSIAELEELQDRVAEAVEGITDDTASILSDAETSAAEQGLSELERAWLDSARSMQEVEGLMAETRAAMELATGDQRATLQENLEDLERAGELLREEGARQARQLVESAVHDFEEGMREAREGASEAAAEFAAERVGSEVERLVTLNEGAIFAARAELDRLAAQLMEEGVDEAALEPLDEQREALNDRLASIRENTAAFARDELSHLRSVADAVLEVEDARRVRLDSLRQEVRWQQEALDGVRERSGSLDDEQEALRGVTEAQLSYVAGLQDEVDALASQQSALRDSVSVLRDLRELQGDPVSDETLDVQRENAEAAFEHARALQEQGASIGDVTDAVQTAIGLWNDFQGAQSNALGSSLDSLRELADEQGEWERRPSDNPLLLGLEGGQRDEDVARAQRQLARRMAETLEVSYQEALQLARQATEDEDFDPFEGLDVRQPETITEIADEMAERFRESPEEIATIEERIGTLEDRIVRMQQAVRDAVDFEAPLEGALSGYEALVERVEGDVESDFAGIAREAMRVFGEEMASATTELQEELADQLAETGEEAGTEAGRGLIDAFIEGLEGNRSRLMDEIEDIMSGVRDFLPSSDARRGPLSTLTSSGRALVRTFASGALSQGKYLEGRVGALMQRAVPNPSVRTAGASVAAGGASVARDINLYLDGRRQGTPGPLAMDARRIVADAEREIRLKDLMGGE